MKKQLMSLLLSLTLAATPVQGETGEQPYEDVPADAWFAPYVQILKDRGTVNGYEDGSFRPYASVSWGEALKLILLANGFREQKREEEEDHWASGYLSYAMKHEYLPEDADPDLDSPLTRNDVADLCASALELSTGAGSRESPFADSSRRSVLELYAAGILEGSVEDGQRLFKGEDLLSRAEISAILTRVMDFVDENYVFVSGLRAPINFDLRFHSYDPDSFHVGADGRLYCDDPERSPRYGIDVSYYQGEIDWEQVAADGIDFAIIRCGGRGYGSAGKFYDDIYFEDNMKGALAAGLDVGVYFFSQALTVEEALEEAAYTLERIRDYPVTFPVVFDWEQVYASGSRTRYPNWEAVGDCALAFCGAVAQAGYTPMTYFNKHMAYLQVDMEKFQRFNGWLAMYSTKLDYIYDFQMWQYSSTGRVKGITGLDGKNPNVDMNICFVDFSRH